MNNKISIISLLVGLSQTLSFASPFLDAVGQKDLTTIRNLLDSAEPVAVIDEKNSNGDFALMIIAVSGDSNGILKELLDRGAQIDLQNDGGMTSLMGAIRSRHYDEAKILIDRGARTYLQDKQGKTVLSYAIEKFNQKSNTKYKEYYQEYRDMLATLIRASSIENQVEVVDAGEVKLLDQGNPGSYHKDFVAYGSIKHRREAIKEYTNMTVEAGPVNLIFEYLE